MERVAVNEPYRELWQLRTEQAVCGEVHFGAFLVKPLGE
jgi:hypothetical protein